MSVQQCEVCRSYHHDDGQHHCHGLRTVDWLRFVHALRDWMGTDNYALFTAYYAHHEATHARPTG